jgi:hypothetical protein
MRTTISAISLGLALSALSGVSAQQCKLQFDGRVPSTFRAANFDAANNIFNPSNVLGKGNSHSLSFTGAAGSMLISW